MRESTEEENQAIDELKESLDGKEQTFSDRVDTCAGGPSAEARV